ncbi:beta-1,6-N-acetylglucosaminyltransferase [Mangrovimicrobium sediminis]|uniref:beta-1,6-N-acetylglucosaminyltransferase n=1 Tax=Mangrovimicrobium sediminis TaxID=2562682 RepID=UPI001436CA6E|nr:beta-1,6-N-acetylglucosaminyltransferase [Haliea sp. SAOS-164]
MNKAYVVIAHQCNSGLFALLGSLLRDGSHVAVHFDRAASPGAPPRALLEFADRHPKLLLADPVAVVWGEWSIVQATLNALQCLRETGEAFDYVTLLSGACMPTKPIALLDQFLADNRGSEFIECVDPGYNLWVKGGYQQERWRYYHFVNWRKSPHLFDLAIRAQHALGIKRQMPDGLAPRMGSQWWTLSWPTLCRILDYHEERRLEKFFGRTWVPDELFFQTLVYALVDDRDAIRGHGLTHYDFDPMGMPRVYYDDNFAQLICSARFFGRKISPWATSLQSSLAAVAAMDVPAFISRLDDAHGAAPIPFPRDDLALKTLQFFGTPVSARRSRPRCRLRRNGRYFVVVSCDEGRSRALQRRCNALPGYACHGHLLGNSWQSVVDDINAPAVSRVLSLAQRDADRRGFLRQVLSSSEGELPGFLLNPERDTAGREMLRELSRDPACTLILDQHWRADPTLPAPADVLSLLPDCAGPPAKDGSASLVEYARQATLHDTSADRLRLLRWLHAQLVGSACATVLVGEGELENWSPGLLTP